MDTWKGLHILIRDRENLLALADAAETQLAALGVNTIVAEIDDCFVFRRYPELSAGDIEASDAREFSRRCRAAGITVIPLYNCLGHQGWKGARNALLRSHPEFDETPWIPEDAGLDEIYCPSWCASDDGVYRYVFSALDEIVEAFGCSMLHVGMDETFHVGKCPRCAHMDRSDLFARTVNILHAYLASKGVGMMMWGDRYLDGDVIGHEWEADKLGIHPAVHKVPRDIAIADWHYERGGFPSVGILLDHGFETVWPSCWRDREAALSFLASAREQAAARGMQARVPGMLVTCWSLTPVRLRAALAGGAGVSEEDGNFADTLRAVMRKLTVHCAL